MSQTQGSMVLSIATEYSERLFPFKENEQDEKENIIQITFDQFNSISDNIFKLSNEFENNKKRHSYNATRSKTTSFYTDDSKKDLYSEANSLVRKLCCILNDFEGQLAIVYSRENMKNKTDMEKMHYIKLKTILLHKCDVLKRSIRFIVDCEEKNKSELKEIRKQEQMKKSKTMCNLSFSHTNTPKHKYKDDSYFNDSNSFNIDGDSFSGDAMGGSMLDEVPLGSSVKFELETMIQLEENIKGKINNICDILNNAEEIYNIHHPHKLQKGKEYDWDNDSQKSIQNVRSWKMFSIISMIVVIILLMGIVLLTYFLNGN